MSREVDQNKSVIDELNAALTQRSAELKEALDHQAASNDVLAASFAGLSR